MITLRTSSSDGYNVSRKVFNACSWNRLAMPNTKNVFLKFDTLVYTLDCKASWINKTLIRINHKLLQPSSLMLLVIPIWWLWNLPPPNLFVSPSALHSFFLPPVCKDKVIRQVIHLMLRIQTSLPYPHQHPNIHF